MELRDCKRFFLVLFALLAIDLALALAGVREPKAADYDKNSVVAALFVVLWAIREEREPG